ncbi:hypothetical protein UC34_07485 [Pandoraea vervacti]|uniref:Transposase n=1 Tax=Pandoraea vervacti TaxID=656178 RepID=A0ABM5SWL1_9BURK|nr:hypothetical protein UC34_07485 [Pandoraea vervacti]
MPDPTRKIFRARKLGHVLQNEAWRGFAGHFVIHRICLQAGGQLADSYRKCLIGRRKNIERICCAMMATVVRVGQAQNSTERGKGRM